MGAATHRLNSFFHRDPILTSMRATGIVVAAVLDFSLPRPAVGRRAVVSVDEVGQG
jgi:hypothetical protein